MKLYIWSMFKSFGKFLEEKGQAPFINSIEDILGINPDDLSNEPQLATFFRMSKGTNLGSYKIVRFKRNSEGKITHAVVRPMDSDKTYKDEKGKIKIVPNPDSGDKLVPIDALDGLLSQDLKASQPI